MVFWSPFWMSSRFHWPMQGPQALASTVAADRVKVAIWPSRSMVARICSRAGRDEKADLRLQAVGQGLPRHVGGARDVLVGGVGAAADQRRPELLG